MNIEGAVFFSDDDILVGEDGCAFMPAKELRESCLAAAGSSNQRKAAVAYFNGCSMDKAAAFKSQDVNEQRFYQGLDQSRKKPHPRAVNIRLDRIIIHIFESSVNYADA